MKNLLLVLGVLLAFPTLANAQPADRAATLESKLRGPATAETSKQTGLVRAVSSVNGEPLTSSTSSDPVRAARGFLREHATSFGIRSTDSLSQSGERQQLGNRSVVRLDQVRDGVPIIAAQFVVTTDDSGRVLSVGGEATDAKFGDTTPELTSAQAADRAIAVVAKRIPSGRATLTATNTELNYFDPRLLGQEAEQLAAAALVWKVRVRSLTDEFAASDILVDARTGTVSLRIPVAQTALDRQICDADSTSDEYPCESPTRSEGQAASGVADVDRAYEFSGDYYDFLDSNFGRDSIDDAGLPLLSTVRWCPDEFECPYENAYWDGEQAVFGEDFAVDDILAHELTHGLNDYTFDPYYWFQTGAIDESYADIFGELIDQTNGAGSDGAPYRWDIGEDSPFGAIRNLADPGFHGDPDSTFSSNYYAVSPDTDPWEEDLGGVHTNSSVPNKVASLLVDGGVHNSQSVLAIGATKTARLFYDTASSLLSAGSDFADLASGLKAVCALHAATNAYGFTTSNCASVNTAISSTGLELDPPAASAPEAPECEVGSSHGTFASDDAETPGGLMDETSTNYWFRTAMSQHQGDHGFAIENLPYADEDSLVSAPISIPTGATMRFDHSFNVEAGFDGGVVEYSANGGPWTDTANLPTTNGYSGPIVGGSASALAGRMAFTGTSNGYRSTRIDLFSLAGSSVRFRFRFASDDSVEWFMGWRIDDIRFYVCDVPPQPPARQPTPGFNPDAVAKPKFSFLKTSLKRGTLKVTFAVTGNTNGMRFQCRLDRGKWRPCRSPKVYKRLKRGKHVVRVLATNPVGTTIISKRVRRR